MNKGILQTFTEEEKIMAEKYHDYIYYFLRKKGYPIEEYYDIAAIGYLKSVQKYCRNDNLRLKWAFATICEHDMWREIGNEEKKENTKNRIPKSLLASLNAIYQSESSDDKGCPFENAIVLDNFEEDLICADTVERMLSALTKRQRKIVLLKMEGYTHKEIKNIIDISLSTIANEIITIKNILSASGY